MIQLICLDIKLRLDVNGRQRKVYMNGVFVNESFLAEIIGDEEFDDEFDDDDDDEDYYDDDSKNYDDESDDIY